MWVRNFAVLLVSKGRGILLSVVSSSLFVMEGDKLSFAGRNVTFVGRFLYVRSVEQLAFVVWMNFAIFRTQSKSQKIFSGIKYQIELLSTTVSCKIFEILFVGRADQLLSGSV